MYLNRWVLKNENINDNSEISKFSKILFEVLKNRGIVTESDIENFIKLNQKYQNPFELKDMQRAVDRINVAISNNENMVIYGDYDVDGITSTVILFLYLKSVNANVSYYIPSRDSEGYGLNINAINELSKECKLIITVDNGVTAVEEVEYANKLGLDVVITDHHKPLSKLPNAIAVIDPHRTDCSSGCENLAGVGVVFKLISALSENIEKTLHDYSDIVCLGTISDMMPIIGENRFIVKMGFEKLKTHPNVGVKALMDICKINAEKITSADVSYKLAPRLNSASRMNEIDIAIKLLLCDDYEQAAQLAYQLEEKNNQRKKIESEMMLEINKMVLKDPAIVDDNIIIIAKEGWNHSVAGIIASKLVNKYNKPCILISIDGELANGSGRSVEGIPLVDVIDYCKDELVRYGGHDLAAGFVVKSENINKFCDKMKKYVKETYTTIPIKSYEIDCELKSSDITVENINDLSLLEPYGLGNERPVVVIKKAKIINIIGLSNGKYTKIHVEFEDYSKLEFLIFNIPYNDFYYEVGDVIDVIVNLGLNFYNNVISPSLSVEDLRPAEFDENEYFYHVYLLSKLKGVKLKENELHVLKNNVPSRKEMAIVYKYLKGMKSYTYTTLQSLLEYLFIKLSNYKLNYIKIGLSVDFLIELDLLLLNSKIEFKKVEKKADISNSKTYKLLAN